MYELQNGSSIRRGFRVHLCVRKFRWLGPAPRDADSVDLGWRLRICLSDTVWEVHLEILCVREGSVANTYGAHMIFNTSLGRVEGVDCCFDFTGEKERISEAESSTPRPQRQQMSELLLSMFFEPDRAIP